MVVECFLRWFLISFVLLKASTGSNTLPTLDNERSANAQDGPQRYGEQLAETDQASPGEETVLSNGKTRFDKRMKEVKPNSNQNAGLSWWPWHEGMAPVRRSFFVPRLGKRLNEILGEELSSPLDNGAEDIALDRSWVEPMTEGIAPVTPAEEEYIQRGWSNGDEHDELEELNRLFNEETYREENENDFPVKMDNPSESFERDQRTQYSFAPRLGKRAYSFAPRLGKKAYAFAPRLGKKAYSFAPRLGKKSVSFAPRLGKRGYSFAPRLGKKAYSFSARLGK